MIPYFTNPTGAAVADAARQRGFAIIRDALPDHARFREAALNIYPKTKEDGFREAHADALVALDRGDIWPHIFEANTDLKYHDAFACEPAQEAVTLLVGPSTPTKQTIIRVGPHGAENTTPGVPLHTDGIIQGDAVFSVTLWITLDRCGDETPGLVIVDDGHEGVRAYTEFKGGTRTLPIGEWDYDRYSEAAFRPDAIRAHYGPRVLTPILDAGDMVIFTNWTIHGTLLGGNKPRLAIIERYDGDQFDPLFDPL